MVRQMTDAHKAANAKARAENMAVSDYLDTLVSQRSKPGRKRSTESLRQRQGTIAAALESATPIQRVSLIQERSDIQRTIDDEAKVAHPQEFEEGFVVVAVSYSGRKGITYSTWREVGVPAAVLQRAGISRL